MVMVDEWNSADGFAWGTVWPRIGYVAVVAVLNFPVGGLADDHLLRAGRALERAFVALGFGLAVLVRPARMAGHDGLVVDPVGSPDLLMTAATTRRAGVLGEVLHAVAALAGIHGSARHVRVESDVHHAGLGPTQERLQRGHARDDDAQRDVALRADVIRHASEVLILRSNQLPEEEQSADARRDDT